MLHPHEKTQNITVRSAPEAIKTLRLRIHDKGRLSVVVKRAPCALLNYELLHEDLFFETSGEFFGVWERVKPILREGREKWANPLFLTNLEKAAARFEAWSNIRTPGAIAAMRQMMK